MGRDGRRPRVPPRPVRPAAPPIDDGGDCRNCRNPPGDGVRTRILKDFAFHVVGTEEEARELDRAVAQVALAQARASGSWRTVVAPPRRASAAARRRDRRSSRACSALPATRSPTRATREPDRLSPGRPELGRAGGRADEPPLPRPLRPAAGPAPVAEELGGAARFVIREGGVPVLPPRPRRGPVRRDRLVYEDAARRRVRARSRRRSPFEVWVVPRRHDADFGGASDADVAPDRRGAPPRARALAPASTARRTTSCSTRRR